MEGDARFTLNYGLRYEVNTRQHEAELRKLNLPHRGLKRQNVPVWKQGEADDGLNPQPPYNLDLRDGAARIIDGGCTRHRTERRGESPRFCPRRNGVCAGWRLSLHRQPQRPAFAICTGAFPKFRDGFALPPVYTTSGSWHFRAGAQPMWPPNTLLDVPRFSRSLRLTPGHQAQPLARVRNVTEPSQRLH